MCVGSQLWFGSANLAEQPQPLRHALLNVLVRAYLYHDDAIVSDVGFGGHGRDGPRNFGLGHQLTLLVAQPTKLRSKPCSRE